MDIEISSKNYDFFNALGSKTRLNILNTLIENPKNITELSKILGISTTIVAKHINLLKKANLIETEICNGTRGAQKICKIKLANYKLFYNKDTSKNNNITEYTIPVGTYQNYNVKPTCGLATKKEIIGICDDYRYFSHPKRFNASILWFKSGWVQYVIPSYIFKNKKLKSLELSTEICSEYPGINNEYLSDIYFEINNIQIGKWTSPGDFGNRKGNFTPKWWYLTEYGILKKIKITEYGCYIDNEKISDIKIKDLELSNKKDNYLKISAPKNTKNSGGLHIFGKEFGDYNQDIIIKLEY